MVEGQNQQSRNDKATEFQGGTVHLLDSTNAISDSATWITSNASTSTADGDWTITHDNANGTTTRRFPQGISRTHSGVSNG